MRPKPEEHSPYHLNYIKHVPEEDILAVLEPQRQAHVTFLNSIPESNREVIHAPYTWTMGQAIQHIVDCERIFGYRIVRIARKDATPLPGFEENDYAAASLELSSSIQQMAEEFSCLRKANTILLQSLPTDAWDRAGLVNNCNITVRALAYILVGHIRHHEPILRKRIS